MAVVQNFYQAFLDHTKFSIGHQPLYTTPYGCIQFFTQRDSDEVLIYYVSINDEDQRKGIFTNFLKEIIDRHPEIRKIGVLAVGSYKMIWCLEKFTYNEVKFCDHGGDYIWARDKNICLCHSYDELVVHQSLEDIISIHGSRSKIMDPKRIEFLESNDERRIKRYVIESEE